MVNKSKADDYKRLSAITLLEPSRVLGSSLYYPQCFLLAYLLLNK